MAKCFDFLIAIIWSLLQLVYPAYGDCGNSAVGVFSDTKIPDDNITSSTVRNSATPARNGRLSYTRGPSWCASSSEKRPYLQVDLGDSYIICAVSTQGNSKVDQWVKSYQVGYSLDKKDWLIYREQNEEKTFHGNYDRNTVVKRFLYEGIQARYIRVYPKTSHGGAACMRLELYGVTKKVCVEKAIGVSHESVVPNYRFTASTYLSLKYAPYTARLYGQTGWISTWDDRETCSLNIDISNVYILCAVETQGRTTKYALSASINSIDWTEYTEEEKQKIFNGNRHHNDLIKNKLKNTIVAKVVKFLPKEFYSNYPELRVEMYGIVQACGSSLGIESSNITDSQLSASSGTAQNGRLYNKHNAWCANSGSTTEYLMVDLKYFALIRAVATQGHPKERKWRKEFAIKYSFDNRTWQKLYDNTSSKVWKIFTTAGDQNTMKVNWFEYPFVARYVRIYPQQQEVQPCLRFDLYGCHNVNFPRADVTVIGFTPVFAGLVNVNLECKGRGAPEPDIKWTKESGDIVKNVQSERKDGMTVSKLSIPMLMRSCSRTNRKRTLICNITSYVCQVSYPLEVGGAMVSSQSSTALRLNLPDAVRDLRAKVIEDQTATLVWTAPDPGNASITSYTVYYSNGERQLNVTSKTSTNTFELSNLTPDTNYTVKIVAVSALGEGRPYGEPLRFKTKVLRSEANERSAATKIVVGVVASVLFVLLLLVIVFIIVFRRKKQTQCRTARKEETNLSKVLDKELQMPSTERENQRGISNESREQLSFGVSKSVSTEDERKNCDASDQPVASKIESRSGYSNVLDETERQPIPVSKFSEFMTRIRTQNFDRLKKQYQALPEGKQFPTKEAEKPENAKLNRYTNMTAYDHSRVIVDPAAGVAYINANYIEGWDGTPKTYIATQGPLPPTLPIFWLMVWNEQVSCIVMLANVVENGKTKCHQYWPEKAFQYGDVNVSLTKVEVFADYTIRTFCLTKDSESRSITQFHFTVWPDHGVPRLPTNIISLRRRVDSRSQSKGPILVHCSAGVGRTGAYIAIDAMLKRANTKMDIDIYNYTQTMRKARINMIQTKEQYIFVHEAILDAITCGNTEINVQDMQLSLNKLAVVNQQQGKTGYQIEFEHLNTVCPNARPDECEAAFKKENLKKNRSSDSVPLDVSRVFLNTRENNGEENYINASFADAYRERNKFILTQAPLAHTIEHFWSMVYDHSIGLVVMLNSLNEGGTNYPKYWPNEGVSGKTYGEMSVVVTSQEVKCSGTLVLSKLEVVNKKENERPKTVRHLQHNAWPDHSVPKNKQSVLDLITMVTAALQQSGNTTLVVQCSDGVGRCGTFCAIYSILERVKLEQVVDVFQAVKALRVRRPGAVKTPEQYKFCYEIVQVFLDSFSDYSNFSDA